MTFKKKVDDNQKQIVQLFRDLGANVAITSSAGNGFPDLVVQYRCPWRCKLQTFLVEIKNSELPPSKRRLTKAQVKFHAVFNCHIVECEQDIYDLLGMVNPDGEFAE